MNGRNELTLTAPCAARSLGGGAPERFWSPHRFAGLSRAHAGRYAGGLAFSRTPGGTLQPGAFPPWPQASPSAPPLRGADGLAANSPTRLFGCALLAVNAPPSGRP